MALARLKIWAVTRLFLPTVPAVHVCPDRPGRHRAGTNDLRIRCFASHDSSIDLINLDLTLLSLRQAG